MAQTERDNVTNRTNLADNTSGDISETDMRDALASAMGYGGMVLTTSGAPALMPGLTSAYTLVNVFNSITAQSIDVNLAGTSLVLSPDWRITFGSNGLYKIDFYASFNIGTDTILVTFAPFLNGSVDILDVQRFFATGAETHSVAFSMIVARTAADFMDVRVKVDTGTVNSTFLGASFSAHRVG